jgi:hypothetical protein
MSHLSSRLARAAAAINAQAEDESQPRQWVWRLGDPAPPGLRAGDRVVRVPRKAPSPEAWVAACFARRSMLPPAPEEDTA